MVDGAYEIFIDIIMTVNERVDFVHSYPFPRLNYKGGMGEVFSSFSTPLNPSLWKDFCKM